MWTINKKSNVVKQIKKLPLPIKTKLFALIIDLTSMGPQQPTWPNFSKLKGKKGCYHCHIKKGNPT